MTEWDLDGGYGEPVWCPICDCIAHETETRYGTRHSCCGLWSWNGAPLADEGTHEARKAAHAAFDPIWKDGHLSRREAYARLSKLLRIAPDECHMKYMDEGTATLVPSAARRIMADISKDDGVVIE